MQKVHFIVNSYGNLIKSKTFAISNGEVNCEVQLLLREWPNVLALLVGLIAIKTAIITAIGPRVGLSLSESVRTGLLLSQGGEFAFVVFSLANR